MAFFILLLSSNAGFSYLFMKRETAHLIEKLAPKQTQQTNLLVFFSTPVA